MRSTQIYSFSIYKTLIKQCVQIEYIRFQLTKSTAVETEIVQRVYTSINFHKSRCKQI